MVLGAVTLHDGQVSVRATARIVSFTTRSGLRRSARSLAALVLLLAVAAGGAMGAAAGARRTGSSDERLAAISAVPELFAFAAEPALFEALLDRPGVAGGSAYRQLGLQPATAPCDDSEEAYFPIQAPSAGTPFAVPRPRLVHGRWADPAAPGQAMVSEQHAARLGVGVGDRLGYRAVVLDEEGEPVGCTDDVVATVTVVGVLRELFELGAAGEPTLATTYLTPAFVTAHPDVPDIGFGSGGFIDLDDGVDPAAFSEGLAEEFGRDDGPAAGALPLPFGSSVDPALDAAAVGLWALAAVLATGGALALVVGLLRQAGAAGTELRQLHALGLGPRPLAAVAAGPGVMVGLAGTLLAAALAVVSSRFHLVGLAARVEPDPGFDVDLAVLLPGVAVTLVVCGLATAAVALWASGAATRPVRAGGVTRPGVGDRISARGLPPWAALGTDYALGRPRRTELPARGALLTAVAGTAGVMAILLFGQAVRSVAGEPSVYGWGDWAGFAGPAEDAGPDADVTPALQADPDVVGVAHVSYRFKLKIDGQVLSGLPVARLSGDGGPTIVAGTPPSGPGQLALGVNAAERLGAGIGDEVEVAGPEGQRARATVTATFAFPSYDGDSIGSAWLADRTLVDGVGWPPGCNDEECFEGEAVTLRDGADVEAFEERMRRAGIDLTLPAPPPDVVLVGEADTLPTVAAAGLAVIAVLGLGHTLAITIERRRRELAVTRALGFERRHVRLVIHMEAAVLGLAGAVAGALIGVVVGRASWRQAAERIGIGPTLRVPVGLVAGVAAGVLLICLLLSLLPARAAARRVPAAALRDL